MVGAGRMGRGLAHVFAYAGYRVCLIDLKDRPEADAKRVLAEAAAEVDRTLSLIGSFGQMAPSLAEKIAGRVDYIGADGAPAALAAAEVVFEGVPEVMDAKRDAFATICRHVGDDAIIASTTSTILVDTLAEFVTHPGRFLNAHWLNPAFLIPLVEVSPGAATAGDTVEKLKTLLEAAGKVPVVCAASPGFIVPRIQALAMNEAARMVEEGVASPEELDKAIRVGFGLRYAVMGLIEFIDWGGGDILYYASDYLKDAMGDDRFAAPAVIRKNMETGRTGMKAGKGFYDFEQMDLDAYQRETLAKLADLLNHLGLMPKPGATER